MSTPEPLRPDAFETVLFEPDDKRVVAVLPGALWLSPGDVVELQDPPRDARVLSSRLQLDAGVARVLVVLDVPDGGDEAMRGEQPTEAVLAVEVGEPVAGLAEELDRDLEALEADLQEAPEEIAGPAGPGTAGSGAA